MNDWTAFVDGFELGDFSDTKRTEEYVDYFSLRLLLAKQSEGAPDKAEKDARRFGSVDPENMTPYPPQWSDLARLHWICLSREVVNVVEFGSGQSTAVLAHALELNETVLSEWVGKHRRHPKPFTLTTVDESSSWLEVALSRVPERLIDRICAVSTPVRVGLFGGRVCSFYENVPDLVADLVYIDGPSQNGYRDPQGLFDFGKPHLMPMSGDVLRVEHFFEPGAIVVFDGRTSNARFFRSNLQRTWVYEFLKEGEVHIFELQEESLGPINSNRLDRLGAIRERFLLK